MSFLLLSATVSVSPAATAGLPLKNDDVLGMALLFKVAIFTGLLLLGTYLALRFYAKLNRGALSSVEKVPPLQCESALRLSTRTRVYLVNAGHTRILVTESASGSQAVILPSAKPEQEGAQS